MLHHLSERRAGDNGPTRAGFSAQRWARGITACVFLLGLSGGARALDEYRLDVGDVIEVTVAGLPDLRQRLPVQLDGSISYPHLGRLMIAGTTVTEAQRAIQSALSSQVFRQRLADGREVMVTVEPREISALVVEYRPVYVNGDVSRPGEQPYRPLMTVRQAVSVAGGYDIVRFGTKAPMSEITDALGEHESVAAELANDTANIGRIRRELGDKDAAMELSPGSTALPRKVQEDLKASQADLLETDQTDYARERSFLKSGSEQLAAQVQILGHQQKDEEQGLKIDSDEVDKLEALFSKGAVTGQRVTDARRALLLSSTRALQATAQLMQTTRQKDEINRQLERLNDQRRMKLLSDLSDRIAKAHQLQSREEALNKKVLSLGALPNQALGAARLPDVHIVRRARDGGHERIPADEDAELRPGDVVEVALKMRNDLAAAAP